MVDLHWDTGTEGTEDTGTERRTTNPAEMNRHLQLFGKGLRVCSLAALKLGTLPWKTWILLASFFLISDRTVPRGLLHLSPESDSDGSAKLRQCDVQGLLSQSQLTESQAAELHTIGQYAASAAGKFQSIMKCPQAEF